MILNRTLFFFNLSLILISLSACQNKSHPRPPLKSAKPYSRSAAIWYLENPRIDKFVRQYIKGTEPEILLQRSKKYLPTIRRIFFSYQLPNELCLLPMIESAFKEDAQSARARGMWQFTAETAKDMGLHISFLKDERKNWEKSTVAAAKYLHYLSQQFEGDWALVLAAYNMGPGAIKREMARQKTGNYWQLKLKEETMNYVPKFLALIKILRELRPAKMS